MRLTESIVNQGMAGVGKLLTAMYRREPFMLAVDPADNPANPSSRFETVSWVSNATVCVMLVDMAGGAAVSAIELWHTTPPWQNDVVRLRCELIALTSGEHQYSLDDKITPSGASYLTAARIIVERTGPSAVGGFAELSAVAGAPGASGMASATYAVLAGPTAGVLASLVLSTLHARRRWLRYRGITARALVRLVGPRRSQVHLRAPAAAGRKPDRRANLGARGLRYIPQPPLVEFADAVPAPGWVAVQLYTHPRAGFTGAAGAASRSSMALGL